ncbi:hypothetical protein ZYGM_001612 [Zygosaccharomyces mellis]|uniref:Uncharacterized protein n=1 Tax=Zygosaccharomyces mellis TaxID=42258 RepID=A0A4C2ECR9_9SACH|nr:hypothetical protein ZYGM_001612 [Zygosaccharomyces mellis]
MIAQLTSILILVKKGLFRGILNGDSSTCPIWKVIPPGGCLALDASNAPSYLVAFMENDGILISCPEGVFRLKETAIHIGNESCTAVDVSKSQLATVAWQERLDIGGIFHFSRFLLPDESVLHVKCMSDYGALHRTNQRLVVIQADQLQAITTNGSVCFHYDSYHIYTV